jgi:glycosyltransferase involved in cell wall biosynthesis
LEKGGAETHLSRVLPDLISCDVEVSVFCISRKGELSDVLENAGIPVVAVPIIGSLVKRSIVFKPLLLIAAVFFFLFHIFSNRVDVIHFFLPESYLLMGPVSLLHMRSKKLMSRRSLNTYQKKYPAIVRKFECWLHGRMDLIIGNSRKVVQQLKYDELVPEDKLRLIYNGVVVPTTSVSVRSRVRRSLKIPIASTVMTVVANLIPYKGHKDLLEACSMLENGDWRLLLVGYNSSDIQCELEFLAQEKNISAQVFFLGSRNDVSEILAASDIGLLVSHEEGFSNAILEGMAAALPMVVSNVGGNSEAVVNAVSGFVVPVKKPKEIQRALDTLICNENLRKKMGVAGQVRVRNQFSHEACVKQYKELYGTVLGSVKYR